MVALVEPVLVVAEVLLVEVVELDLAGSKMLRLFVVSSTLIWHHQHVLVE